MFNFDDYHNPNDNWDYGPYKGMDDDERVAAGIGHAVMTVLMFIVMFAVMAMCSSCTTVKYVPVIEHKTDTVRQCLTLRDSIWLHDSISVKEKGDTVRIEKWHTKCVSKEVHDTTYISKTDSIPVPYEVVKEVQRPLAKTQIAMMVIGFICTFLVVVYIGRKIRGLLP